MRPPSTDYPLPAMGEIVLDAVTKLFPGDVTAVDNVSLTIGDGEFMVLVGPSGCGKSTLLRAIAGLEEVTSGSIRIGERDVTRLPPRDRDVAMIFQTYALYPHIDVRDNLAYGLKMRKTSKQEIARRVGEVARMLGLEELLDRRPAALSGGQRQRVAIARALSNEPLLVLADEPTGNLDSAATLDVLQLFERLHESGQTLVIVTHDARIAATADRMISMRDGAFVDETRLTGGTTGQLGALVGLED
jgi:ABC-type sugar transport system ATPase subunit